VITPLRPDDPRAIGPYRLCGQLGCGGMGQVFLGHAADGLPVAVKVIRAELAADDGFRAQFRQEVAASRRASGMFTARVVDADLDGPVPWLATEYVAGPSLTEAVSSRGPLPVDEVLRLAAGLADGLIAIHAAGVVHRDLKPSNILLAKDGPRVIDFGISWAAWASTMPGWGFGSPRFMSPEHALGQVIGPPSDIFSLGAVLTFAATGQGPFGSGSSDALIYRVVNSPARLDPVPEEVRGLVASCLAKHPEDRPTAGQVLSEVGAIERATTRQPIAEAAGSENEADIPALAAASSGAALTARELQPGRADRDLRRRASRSLPLFVPGLLAAGATAFYLFSAGASSPATLTQQQATAGPSAPQGQPQGTGAAAGSGPTPGVGATVSPSAHKDRVGPSIIQGLPASAFLSPSAFTSVIPPALTSVMPSALASVIPAPSSSGSAAPRTSPSPSPSSSKSGSPSPSPSPSPSSSSSSPSPSPSPSSSSPSPSPSSSSPSATPTPSTSASPSTSPT
jgi:serine/threonine protein kinase